VSADLFSAGAVVFLLVTGNYAFGTHERRTMTCLRNVKCQYHLEGPRKKAFEEHTCDYSR